MREERGRERGREGGREGRGGGCAEVFAVSGPKKPPA